MECIIHLGPTDYVNANSLNFIKMMSVPYRLDPLCPLICHLELVSMYSEMGNVTSYNPDPSTDV